MRALRRFLARLAGAAGSRRDDQMEEEFLEHIELQTADYIRSGIPPEEARRRALLKFGPLEALKEEYRDQRGIPTIESFLRDLRRAMRTLLREPGFTFLTIVMLGLGLAGAISELKAIGCFRGLAARHNGVTGSVR